MLRLSVSSMRKLKRDGNTLEYDGMTLQRLARPTPECAAALEKRRCRRRCRISLPATLPPEDAHLHVLNDPHADAACVAKNVASP